MESFVVVPNLMQIVCVLCLRAVITALLNINRDFKIGVFCSTANREPQLDVQILPFGV